MLDLLDPGEHRRFVMWHVLPRQVNRLYVGLIVFDAQLPRLLPHKLDYLSSRETIVYGANSLKRMMDWRLVPNSRANAAIVSPSASLCSTFLI